MSKIEQKIGTIIYFVKKYTGYNIQYLNPEFYPGYIKPVKWIQIDFEDGDSLSIPIFENRKPTDEAR